MKIDKEFKSLIPPLAAEELSQLESNLKADGCRDPLVVWNDTLIDGHNRYAICTKHDIKYKTVSKSFETKDDAKIWIIQNQFGRRNLALFSRGELAIKFKELIAKKGLENNKAGGKLAGKSRPKALTNLSKPIAKTNTREVVAKIADVSQGTISKVELITKHADEETKDKLRKDEVSVHKVATDIKRQLKETERETRREENRKKISSVSTPEKTQAKFATIVIDPPWDWGDEGDNDQLGRAKPDYATMSIQQLTKLRVGDLADTDCHLYLWITNRSLPKGFGLIEAWGFRFVTMLTWPKPSFGMGNYFRGQTEHVLFGVRGSQMLKRKNASTLLPAWKRGGKHSEKPKEFCEFVESCSPGPYLEMFSRTERTGWVHWGEDS